MLKQQREKDIKLIPSQSDIKDYELELSDLKGRKREKKSNGRKCTLPATTAFPNSPGAARQKTLGGRTQSNCLHVSSTSPRLPQGCCSSGGQGGTRGVGDPQERPLGPVVVVLKGVAEGKGKCPPAGGR